MTFSFVSETLQMGQEKSSGPLGRLTLQTGTLQRLQPIREVLGVIVEVSRFRKRTLQLRCQAHLIRCGTEAVGASPELGRQRERDVSVIAEHMRSTARVAETQPFGRWPEWFLI